MPSPSLNANNKPSWPVQFLKRLNPFASRIEPEIFSQERDFKFDRYGIRKAASGKFGEFPESYSQFNIDRPSAGVGIDPAKAVANNRGFVYAAVNAKAREVMAIEWLLFKANGKDQEEQTEHEALDLLEIVNDNMTSLEFKYLLSACLDLTGNAYVYLEGVENDLDKPKAIHLMPPDRVRPVIDRRSWPYQLSGYKMKLENREMAFQPHEVIHLRLPNAANFFEGVSPVQAGAEYIDNDNYALEFNRKFFRNGARPSGFLESDMVSETQIEALKIGFANMHEGIDNMNRIAILPKGVKWTSAGSSPKDMDFKNLSEDMRDRILAMFGVSRTILGTAESDTNRATAETADYVFSKRVIKPHMMLICSFLNERLMPRYGDDLYLSFLDPVPEDRAARNDEMKTSVGGAPVLTVNEAREDYMGLGPVDGGDVLLRLNTMTPAGDSQDSADGNQQPGKAVHKTIRAANGARIAFRPLRTKSQRRAKQRGQLAKDLAEKITEAVKEALQHPTKKFARTKEADEARWKEFGDRTEKAEQEIRNAIREINAKQKSEVLQNLPAAVEKAIDPSKLFDIDQWISITTDAVTPAIEKLFVTEGKAAAQEIGKPDIDPFSDTAQKMLHESVGKMAKSYNETTLNTLEAKINDGLSQGQSLPDITKTVEEIYEWNDTWRAERVSKTEAFRTANMALKETWKQSGVVKTIMWYTGGANPCEFCEAMNGRVISIDDNFYNQGDSITVGDKTLDLDYSDVGGPPLHPSCKCFARPEDVSLD